MLQRDWKMREKPLLMMKTNLHKLFNKVVLGLTQPHAKIPKSSLVTK